DGMDYVGRCRRLHYLAAFETMDGADAGEKEPEVFDDLRQCADRGPRAARRETLADGDGWRQIINTVEVGFVETFQKLSRGGRKALQVTALGLGVKGVECQAALTRAADAGQHRHLPQRKVEVDILQIVYADPAQHDGVGGRAGGRLMACHLDDLNSSEEKER